ncbi:hypothetical protein ACIQXM_14015 [Arthrobacter sp. NPDC097144]|uniref:hypothetical protein n=1 Tax=Arthrobacter sp. NPDC097144 TaxID=3363946 RepID=UPI003805E130
MDTRGVITTALLIAGTLVLGGCSSETRAAAALEPAPTEEPIGGYEGWWNATPVSGGTTGLPDETVAVLTDTGEIVDASTRNANGQAESVHPDDVEYTVAADPAWPKQSVVIIDTETHEIIESFPVDSTGKPTD